MKKYFMLALLLAAPLAAAQTSVAQTSAAQVSAASTSDRVSATYLVRLRGCQAIELTGGQNLTQPTTLIRLTEDSVVGLPAGLPLAAKCEVPEGSLEVSWFTSEPGDYVLAPELGKELVQSFVGERAPGLVRRGPSKCLPLCGQ